MWGDGVENVLESEKLKLKPLSINELLYIKNGFIERIEEQIEPEAITDLVKSAISKKIEKMQRINEELHQWYTYWLIIYKGDKKGTGFIGFKGIPNEEGYSEVGYSISSNYRRQGLMTAALTLLTNWASKSGECKGITASKVLKTNMGSNAVLKHCNFKLIDSSEEENNYILIFENK